MTRVSYLDVKKNLKADMSHMKARKLAVLGDFATQHLCVALRGVAAKEGISLSVYESAYDQIDLQLFNSASDLYKFEPDEIFLAMCSDKLYSEYCKYPIGEKGQFAEKIAEKIFAYWEAGKKNSRAMILQSTFVEFDDRVFGNYGSKTELSFIFQLRKLNYLLMLKASEEKNVGIIDFQYVASQLSAEEMHDTKLYCMAKLPYTLNALPMVAQQVISVIKARMGWIKKCIILDLDNTLWGGVVGDDGSTGIKIGELGTGQAFTYFQCWLKQLKERGILLAVCSKNEEATAKEPFISNPDMVLHLEDISLFVANWQNKAQNIIEMQKTLNIGMDTIVFIDDNPFERETVRQLVPFITVPEMPEDPAEYVNYLESLNLFETVSFSDEDTHRTDQYRSEINRVQAQTLFSTFEEYLISLNMKATAKPFDTFHIPRIAQLSQRSNQFNLRTVRYSEEDIARIVNSGEYITRYFAMEDKFGDSGLISAVIFHKMDKETLFIDTWFMSCRVLKRGMEEFIINKMVEVAREAGYRKLVGEYIPTAKNAMVSEIYPNMGFESTERENTYILTIADFKPLHTNIQDVL